MTNIYLNSTPPPEKKSWGCLKTLAVGCGVIAAFVLVIVVLAYNALAWIGKAPTPTPATYAPLNLSEGENEDVNRVIASIDAAKRAGTDVEEYVTPAVFNGFFDRIMRDQRFKEGKPLDGPHAIRLSLAEGNTVRLQATVPAEDEEKKQGKPMYVNIDAIFELEIKDGEPSTADLKSLKLNNEEAPFAARLVLNWFVGEWKKQGSKKMKQDWDAVKLLKRDGDRIHVIIDGKKMAEKEAENLQQQNNITTPKPPVPPNKAEPNKPEEK